MKRISIQMLILIMLNMSYVKKKNNKTPHFNFYIVYTLGNKVYHVKKVPKFCIRQ